MYIYTYIHTLYIHIYTYIQWLSRIGLSVSLGNEEAPQQVHPRRALHPPTDARGAAKRNPVPQGAAEVADHIHTYIHTYILFVHIVHTYRKF